MTTAERTFQTNYCKVCVCQEVDSITETQPGGQHGGSRVNKRVKKIRKFRRIENKITEQLIVHGKNIDLY